MDQEAKLAVFRAQVTNVKSLKMAMSQVHRAINAALRTNQQSAVDALTKVYALLFCAWSEANFSKIVHTPYGFSLDEIAEIHAAKMWGISEGWKACVRLGLQNLEAKRSSFRPNVLQRLETAIAEHVYDPSLLRNKLAHGQWVVALNRTNDAIQEDTTKRIEELDIVRIGSWIATQTLLAEAVEYLIESPQKAFMRDWHTYVTNLEHSIHVAESRTLEAHVKILQTKSRRAPIKTMNVTAGS